jgi:hypothetical protein
LSGAFATEKLIQLRHQQIESETQGRWTYKPRDRTLIARGLAGGLGAFGAMVLSRTLLWFTKGRGRTIVLIYGIGVAAGFGYLAAALRDSGETFAEGGAVGGSLGVCAALVLVTIVNPKKAKTNTEEALDNSPRDVEKFDK